eukprot:scaffold4478_cov65-Phaeocystis_antarctica.AAC.7
MPLTICFSGRPSGLRLVALTKAVTARYMNTHAMDTIATPVSSGERSIAVPSFANSGIVCS